jgi:hypothetical protein
MTNTPRRSLLARIRDRLATHESERDPESAEGATDPAPPEAAPEPAPEPPRIVHEFGSQYRVRMSLDEVLAERGRTGTAGLYRRSLAPSGDARRDAQRRAAADRAGFGRDVLWPSEPE